MATCTRPLTSIAGQYGLQASDLASQISNIDRVFVGEVLKIPPASAAPSLKPSGSEVDLSGGVVTDTLTAAGVGGPTACALVRGRRGAGMGRFWIIPVTLVVTVGLAASAASASAAAPAVRPSANQCRNLVNRYQKVSSSASGFNPNDPNSFTKVINRAISELNYLAKQGPKQLRKAFNDLARLYAPLRNVNLSNPASLSELETFATSTRFRNDIHQIAAYFAAQCNFTIPTTPTP